MNPQDLTVPGLRTHRLALEEGVVEVLTVDRPESLNALDADMFEALARRVDAIGVDPHIRAVILTGAGDRAFCAGADLRWLQQLDAVDAAAQMVRGQRVLAELEQLPQPVIAAINGYALGGGLELALACDFRLAAASARLGQPEITLGHIPGWGATQRLPRIVGEPVAKDLILSGRLITAEQAATLRLVHRVCIDGTVVDEAMELARDLARRSATAIAMAKRAIHAGRSGDGTGYAVESHAVALCFTTPAQQRAVAEFLNRNEAAS